MKGKLRKEIKEKRRKHSKEENRKKSKVHVVNSQSLLLLFLYGLT